MKADYNECIKGLYDNPELYINEFMNYKDDIYFWQALIEKIKPQKLLEVGIGNGRLIKLFHDKVNQYDGVDFSQKLIDYCKQNFKYDNVRLYHQDFKKCSLEDKYDLIILPFNVINNFYTIQDLSCAFSSISALCHENTLVVIDTVNPKIEDLSNSNGFIKTNEFLLKGKPIIVYESRTLDIFNLTCLYTKRYMMDDKVIEESILPSRIFFHSELFLLLDYYGFQVVDKYGDYNFEQLSENSRKQIMCIRRKQNETIKFFSMYRNG